MEYLSKDKVVKTIDCMISTIWATMGEEFSEAEDYAVVEHLITLKAVFELMKPDKTE